MMITPTLPWRFPEGYRFPSLGAMYAERYLALTPTTWLHRVWLRLGVWCLDRVPRCAVTVSTTEIEGCAARPTGILWTPEGDFKYTTESEAAADGPTFPGH